MLESALAYFGPQEPESLPRHPIQYYYALNNLVGNLTASGRFEEAYSRAQDLDDLVRNHPFVLYPVLETAVNNFILAGYFSGKLAPAVALDLMERALAGGSDAGDRVLMKSNRAAFLIHARREAEAREVLERVYAEIKVGGEPDAYHLYFVGNNLAALRALSGEVEVAKHIHQEIGRDLGRFYPAVRQTLQKRHELLTPAYNDAPHLTVETFDSYLTDRHAPQLGPQWAFYSRGFLLSDIQFWSAD